MQRFYAIMSRNEKAVKKLDTINMPSEDAPGVRALCKRLAKRAGIEKRVHPHGFRHTHAYELAEEGAPLHLVQAQLGHSSLAVTNRYVSHLNPAELVERMQQRAWA